MATKAKKRGGKKRWSSGSARTCSVCGTPEHNIRTCPKAPKKKAEK